MANSVASGQQQQMKVAEGLPQTDQQGEQDPQRMNRGCDVVAKEFRIAENKTGARIMVGIPGGERQQPEPEAGTDVPARGET